MNEELKIIIKAVTADAQKNMQAVKKELQGISQEAKGTSDKFGAAMKGIAKATTVAIAAITAVVAAIVAFGKSTQEIQRQTAQLNAAFAAAGKSAADAASVYKGFFRFLGESDTAIEASNLLVKLTQDEQNLAQWTKILQGVYATFPDSLPIEGLVESANETARVGVVTGNLADALNWAGENEDAFNEKLAQTNSLEEREVLIRNTLNGLYGRAAEIYEQNNRALLEYNESQADLQQKTAAIGATITPLLTYMNQLGATILTVLKPAFEIVLPYIAGFVMWLTEAVSRVAIFAGLLSDSTDSVKAVGETTAKAVDKASKSTNNINNGLKDMKKNAEAARKAAMGFDELNIVPNPSSSSSTVTGGTGALDNVGSVDMSGIAGGIDGLAGSLEDFQKKAETVKENISQWMDEWSWVLNTIAGILAALSIRSLLIQLGSAVGLGDKLAKVLSFTGVAVGIKKLIGWLGAVIGLLKEGNSFAAVMAVAFPKTAAVISKVVGAITSATKAVAAFVGGLSGGTLALIIAIVAALASAVYFLWENWDAVVQKVNEFCESNLVPIIEEFKGSFEALWGAIQELGASFVNLGASIYGALPDWLQDWLYNVGGAIRDVVLAIGEWFASIDWLNLIGTAIEGLGAIVTGIVGGVIMGAIQAVLNLVESAVQIVTGVVQIISGIVSAFVNLIVGLFTGDFSKALDSVELIWEGIQNVFKGAIDAIIGTVWGFIEGIIDFFVHMWDVLVGHSIVPDTIEAIIEWFAYLPVKVFEIIAGFVKGVIDFIADLAKQIGSWAVTIWNNIKAPFEVVGSWFSSIFSAAWEGIKSIWNNPRSFFEGVWSGIKSAFGNVSDWFRNTFTSAWTAVKNVFSKGGSIFNSIKDGVLDGLKSVINYLIDGINNVVAIPFNGLNEALETLQDLSILGVEPFGWIDTIPVPQIPKLAKGGIVDHATLAMIGERGKEAVVPLENNTGWIDKLVDKLSARNDRPEKIVLMLDGKELGWANINSINNITRQTGALQLVIA